MLKQTDENGRCSIYAFSRFWKVVEIDDKDATGKYLITKDGNFKKVRIKFEAVASYKPFWITLMIIDYKVSGIKIGDIVEVVEIEHCVDMNPKKFGVNAGKPRYAIEPKNVESILLHKKIDVEERSILRDSIIIDTESR